MNPTSTALALKDLLAACVAAFTEQADTNSPPAVQFISHGPPITYLGVDQIAVYSPGLRSVKPMPLTRLSAIQETVIPALDLVVELRRSCWPGASMSSAAKSLPTADQITAATLLLANDAAALFGYVAGLAVHGKLFPSMPTVGISSDIALSPLVALAPQGTLAGWRWPIAVKLAIP